MAGTLVCVVGPSGAGKDSVIAAARALLGDDDRVVFARRVVTRPADAGGEDHLSITPENFVRLRDAGGLALSWEAHGIAYGIPAAVVAELEQGRAVVANVSRTAIPAARAGYNALVVEITADPQVLARRLAGRGRETAEDIASRLARATAVPVEADETIVNDGDLAEAAQACAAILKRAWTIGPQHG